MRRHAEHDFSPVKRQRDRSSYAERRNSSSPRKSQSNRYRCSKFSQQSRHSPKSKRLSDRRVRDSSPDNFHTLCVRNFSSKLSTDIVQQYLFHEFGEFGDFSVSIGHADGERIALLNFKYDEDAREAFSAKPTIHMHDRTVTVTPMTGLSSDSDTRQTLSTKIRHEDLDKETDRRHVLHSTSNKIDPNYPAIFPKHPGLVPLTAPSLLGMPGIASSTMMAAAARALGLNAVPGVIPPPQFGLVGSHSRLNHGNTRHFDHNRGRYSPLSVDSDNEMKATRTLFVGSLEPDISESEVKTAFERFGFIEQIDIKRSPKPGVHSYAFVRFQNVDMACRAKMSMSGRCIRSLHCKIGYAKPITSQCLYIGGLECWTSPESLQRMLYRYGQVTYLDWAPGRKFAVVMYNSCESAMEANKQLKGRSITGRPNQKLRVDFINPELIRPKNQSQNVLEAAGIVENNTNSQVDSQVMNTEMKAEYSSLLNPTTRHNLQSSNRPRPNELISGPLYLDNQFIYEDGLADKTLFNSRQPYLPGKQSFRPSGRTQTYNRNSNRYAGSPNLLSPVDDVALNFQSIVTLQELDHYLQPDLWKGKFLLKQNYFCFRCLLVIGSKDVGQQLAHLSSLPDSDIKSPSSSLNPVLRINRRGTLNPSWMAEATHRVHAVLSTSDHNLCLMLILPDIEPTPNNTTDNSNQLISVHNEIKSVINYQSLHFLVAYLKLKQAAGIIFPLKNQTQSVKITNEKMDNLKYSSFIVYLFAPSSFALSLLKQAVPHLSSDLATTSDYMVLMAMKRSV